MEFDWDGERLGGEVRRILAKLDKLVTHSLERLIDLGLALLLVVNLRIGLFALVHNQNISAVILLVGDNNIYTVLLLDAGNVLTLATDNVTVEMGLDSGDTKERGDLERGESRLKMQ